MWRFFGSFIDAIFPGNAAGNYSIIRTFTATDDAGNSSTGTQTITVEDTTAPVIEAPENFTVECDDLLGLDDPLATDNCGEVTITSSVVTILGNASGNYTLVRTFIATDDAGNVSYEAIQTINVVDTTSPELTIPAGYTVECSAEFVLAEATATDNCGDVIISTYQQTIAGSSAGTYTIYCEFTATDDAGNYSVGVQIIDVVDTTAPSLSIPSDYTAECSDDLVLAEASAIDNCGEVVITLSTQTVDGDATGNYTLTRTFTATDDAGNATSSSQTITVQDTTSPELNIPSDFTVECSDTIDLDAATATDNCGTVEISVVEETVSGSSAGSYSIVRTFTATDESGNATSDTQTITVIDTTSPVLSIPADYTAECSDELVLSDATAADNCSDVVITLQEVTIDGDAPGNYVLVRTFTATDGASNSVTSTQTITVQDTTAPALSIPADYTVECSEEIALDEASATDSCSAVTLTLNELTVPGSSAGNYTIVRTFTVSDESGNSSIDTQTITVVDTTAPVLSVPADYTVECSDEIVLTNVTATDCGDVTFSIYQQNISGNSAGTYSIYREFTATDDAGNYSVGVQIIDVVDTTAPSLSIPSDYTAECSDDLVLAEASAIDNCGEVVITLSTQTVDGDATGNYTLTRTFTATDDAGNATSSSQTITVQDTTSPELNIPSDFTVECSDTIDLDAATATDNCGTVEISVVEETVSGSSAGSYSIVRTFTATDESGNATSDTQTITVIDTTSPVLSIPADYTAECSDELVLSDATAADNCSDVVITLQEVTIDGDAPGNYVLVRTFTATDGASNSVTSTQTITVQDTTAPALSIPADYTVECSEEIALDEASATDSCSAVTLTLNELTVPGSSAGNYTIVRTFTVSDESGNSSIDTQTITVVDTTAPALSIPADYIVECSDEMILDEATAIDNCGTSSISLNSETIFGSSVGTYFIVREFTATDDAGNAISLTQTITVVDTSAPVFSNVAADATVECTDVVDSITPDAVDNCGEVIITFNETSDSGSCEGEYTLTRTWTATDDAGNASDAVQIIVVTDTTAPEFTSLADLELSCSEAVVIPTAQLLPGCSEESFTVVEVTIAGDCPQSYSIVRTYSAIDACGNSTEFVHTTNIIDNTAPVVTDGTCFGLDCPILIDGLQGETIPAAGISISDDCDDAPLWSSSVAPASADDLAALNLSSDESASTRTYVLVDACGNESILYQTFILTFVVEGCTDSAACNYDSVANTEDNSCDYCSCDLYDCGCMDAESCNYDSIAIYDDGSCEYPTPGFDCDGVCYDVNSNGICDIEEYGCTDSAACNYNSDAQVDDGSCDYCNCEIEPSVSSTNSNYSIEIELVTTHDSGALAGQSTYRVYVTTPNTTDIVSAVTGDDNFALSLSTTTSFYQNVFGSNSATSISPAMMSVAPDVVYDSWITIGATSSDDVSGGVINIMPGSWATEFAAGNSFTVNDALGSGWYLLPPGGGNGISGSNQRVLLTQLTTDGEISGSFSVQIFPEGDQINDDRVDFTFAQAPLGNFSCPIIIDGPYEITAECSSVPSISVPSDFTVFTDPAVECDPSDFSVSLLSEDITDGSCEGEYIIVRVLGVTNCTGSSTNFTQTITIVDTTAPELTIPTDYTAECSDAHPMDEA